MVGILQASLGSGCKGLTDAFVNSWPADSDKPLDTADVLAMA
jgi:hypothetical protein